MKSFSIKFKLILLFILIKVIPLLFISFIAYEGAIQLEKYVQQSTRYLFNQNKEIILNTANASIEDSIKNLDKKSQRSLERLSFEIANNVAAFLYERDRDALFLSSIELNQSTLESFYKSKQRNIITHEDYVYNEEKSSWESSLAPTKVQREKTTADLKDNEKEFNFTDPLMLQTKQIPLYKEISYFSTRGQELYKVSQINPKKLNVSQKKNTYINSERYFKKIQSLKKGEIYVSEVIGEYVPSNVIGTFTKEKAQKMKVDFKPENHAYAGKENPVGKRFEGIVRFITPVFKANKKVGYISLALDHEHLMQFTDTTHPTKIDAKQNISNASDGNYAFMWDFEGRNISHPRDYFIAGFDKSTGERAMPWLSKDIAEKYNQSNMDINEFLATYPTFEAQSLKKKPNIAQLKKEGNIGLDCRYLNFAPQCQGWMQLTQNGGFGSFIIYWSKVWKLTTAAAIPYYTGQYENSKRGFGFVTIGANVDEFHAAANETKQNIRKILNSQTEHMKENVDENRFEIEEFIHLLINELSIVTVIMLIIVIVIAIWVSNFISSKIERLILGTQKFANNELAYRIEVESNDEIGKLETSFNTMASKIQSLIVEQKELNEHLEEKVNEKTLALVEINHNLENQIQERTQHLQEALVKAQHADEAKSTFLANMSHEIRTPLNAIIGFSDIIVASQSLDMQTKKQAQIIQGSANTLLTIINDILDVSKIESGNFEISLDKTDIYYVSEQVIELFSKKAVEKQIRLVFNIDYKLPLHILADGVRLRQVLSNLLSNAIKFTPEHGIITVNISQIATEDKKSTIRFEVMDTGIGIPKEQLNTIFNPFVQVDNKSNRKFEGTGLGLSICSHIVSMFDSQIQVESDIGSGTRFWFDVAFDLADERLHDSNKYLDKLNFKIINDDGALFHHVKRYLDIFGSMDDESRPYDAIICTCQEKRIERLEEIRRNYKNIPLLILFEYEFMAKDFGAMLNENEDALALPFFPSKVNDALQELLRKTNHTNLPKAEQLQDTFEGNVLVAEDNTANQQLIKHILTSLGVNHTIAHNGQVAVEAYKEDNFDIVLMDINMPVLDGIEAFHAIREYEKTEAKSMTPVIALTANAIKGDKEKFLSLGMNHYLSKPIKVAELKELFQKYLANQSVRNDTQISEPTKVKVGIDSSKIIAKLGVDEEIAQMLITNFKGEIYQDLEVLHAAIKANDSEATYKQAHYIKNSCLNIVLDEVCELLAKLEDKTLDNTTQEKLFIELQEEINTLF